jgi:hypothetical protein
MSIWMIFRIPPSIPPIYLGQRIPAMSIAGPDHASSNSSRLVDRQPADAGA